MGAAGRSPPLGHHRHTHPPSDTSTSHRPPRTSTHARSQWVHKAPHTHGYNGVHKRGDRLQGPDGVYQIHPLVCVGPDLNPSPGQPQPPGLREEPIL